MSPSGSAQDRPHRRSNATGNTTNTSDAPSILLSGTQIMLWLSHQEWLQYTDWQHLCQHCSKYYLRNDQPKKAKEARFTESKKAEVKEYFHNAIVAKKTPTLEEWEEFLRGKQIDRNNKKKQIQKWKKQRSHSDACLKSKSSTTTELRVTYVWLLGILQDQRGEVYYLMLLMRDVLEEDIFSM